MAAEVPRLKNEEQWLVLAHGAAAAWLESPGLAPLGNGHIHQTFLLSDQEKPADRYVLQCVNAAVYRDIDLLMQQTRMVIERLSTASAFVAEYRLPELIPTRLGESIFVQASDGATYSWRLWRFIEGSKTCDPPQNREQIRQAAKAFGAYQRAMAGLEAKRLVETIPGFLSMTGYLRQFDQVLATATQAERAEAMPWIAVAQSHRQWPSALMQPNAVIHGDCKINNVLFDAQGERVLSVIDLDNNMNGHWAWDFGDLVRSVAFSRGGVDAADYRACVQGFLSGRGSVPLGNEHLIAAPSYLAFMLGLRFLTDHLSGDRYFSVPQHGDNLQRAKEQFALFQSFERSRASMERIVSECT